MRTSPCHHLRLRGYVARFSSSALSAPLREKKWVRAEAAKDGEIFEGSVG